MQAVSGTAVVQIEEADMTALPECIEEQPRPNCAAAAINRKGRKGGDEEDLERHCLPFRIMSQKRTRTLDSRLYRFEKTGPLPPAVLITCQTKD